MAAADAVASAQLGLLLESKEHELQQIQEIERLVDELVAAEGTPAHDEMMVLVDCMYGMIDELAAEEVAQTYAAFQTRAMCIPCSHTPPPPPAPPPPPPPAAAPPPPAAPPGGGAGGGRVECPTCLRVVSSARFAP